MMNAMKMVSVAMVGTIGYEMIEKAVSFFLHAREAFHGKHRAATDNHQRGQSKPAIYGQYHDARLEKMRSR